MAAFALPVFVLAAVALLAATRAVAQTQAAPKPVSLDTELQPYLAEYALPALAAAVVKDGQVVAVGAVGTRRLGADLPVTRDDRFHLGSDTKAMTALLAGMAVEEGKLRWDTTVAEAFPELAQGMDPGLAKVTLVQLLSHTSGVPADNERVVELLLATASQDGNLDAMRYWLVSQWVHESLASAPGTRFEYANMNYVLAGAMVERALGGTWEELVTARVFEPLGLRTAGLGPQASVGRVDAPLGHALRGGKMVAFLGGPNGDNPLVIGPAGTAHMSVLDFARWAGWNAAGGEQAPRLVKPETLAKLHTPVIEMPLRADAKPGTPKRGGYGLGWGQLGFDWSTEPFVFHGGSNEKNLAHVYLQPGHDFALVVMTNVGGEKADAAFQALVPALYARFGPARVDGAETSAGAK